ncbi:E3 ubiquitin-protein ligase HUWE1 isoform X2 [Ischnura elegans]|uniref:E3 ubiquitin-protein ligase HUWE1 isoform X2 n=1 Tax=Ischnura elegans TaxID=197161 RepID=UPI001ED86774|nr:E3 ubiquitin-protein ligase HUWE1 isoform X2 [Ischnura elegans]
MKIERAKLRSGTSDVPAECQLLIDRLKSCSRKELLQELMSIDSWVYGKCELYHWIDVLNICDEILEEAASVAPGKFWELSCDVNPNSEDKELLLWVLHFTTLLIEHSFSRHLYNSMEHLITLLSSCDMNVVLEVLNLLYMFSKRSNFISRLNPVKRSTLICRLTHLAESWGGKENGFGLAECCQDLPMSSFPNGATTLHFEYSSDAPCGQATVTKNKNSLNQITCIHLERVDLIKSSPAEIVKDLITLHNVPVDRQMSLFTNVRLAHCFSDYKKRLLCVRARLQALSILVYSNALQTHAHNLLYSGLLEELVEVLELTYPHLVEIRAAALRTLTSIIHFDRNPQYPRLNTIIVVTGASSYHGFLPVLVRNCISLLTTNTSTHGTNPFPLPLATALFSFLYHLASYEAGGEALVNCGMMECLLRVIDWPGKEFEHVTFVTRAVRVIDLITNIDMQAFQTHGGLTSFINRLEMEVGICRKEQPFEIKPPNATVTDDYDVNMHTDESSLSAAQGEVVNGVKEDNQSRDHGRWLGNHSMDVVDVPGDAPIHVSVNTGKSSLPDYSAAKTGKTCLPQRAALLKSMLNFLKKAIQDSSFTDSIRHVMGESLPTSLKHIISNAEYYGPSLFLLATDIVTVFVFQEPSLLSSLQDNGLTDVVLHALLVKDVPATREVLGSLPNVFSALCLNARGLASFVQCQPFERLFKVLLSPVYLSSMRRRRNSDPNGDTASNLGNAMDELMRHQPSLKVDATAAVIKLLEELCTFGRDPKYVCWRPQNKAELSTVVARGGNGGNRNNEGGGGSSDEEDEEEEEAAAATSTSAAAPATGGANERIPIPLIDYILNVMKFVDAILSNNSTDDHCQEFVAQKGLTPLISILGLPNLPTDHPTTALAMAVSAPIKSVLILAHEPEVFREGLRQLNDILKILEPLHKKCDPPRSFLLRELAEAPDLETAFMTPSATPLLHAIAAAHGYIVMFMLLCRTGENDIRSLTVQCWGSELGVQTLKGLSDLYTSLVWESTLLLSLINGDAIPPGFEFCKEDLDRVKPPEFRGSAEASSWNCNTSMDQGPSNGGNLIALDSDTGLSMEFEAESKACAKGKTGKSYALTTQIKYIKPLLSASSRLGRVLAELLGLMVKVCYGQFTAGSPLRQRRGQQLPFLMVSSSPQAKVVADTLTELLRRSISWKQLPPSPLPKFRLTYLVCTLGFTSPILFDEKKYPYHAMLQRFVSLGGLAAYFDIYRWALSAGGKYSVTKFSEELELPDGTGEFIDSWLMLLEKLVNPRLVFDTPNYLAKSEVAANQMSFPLKFLIHVHKLGFAALFALWGKKPLPKYGGRITESMLTIYRHIIKGEKFIQDKLAKRKESVVEGGPKRGREDGEPEVNLSHVQQLMDMGFKREHCVEALLHTSGLEQATDYLLSNPPPSRNSQIQAMDIDMSEDDQVQRAIAMSLGEDTHTHSELKRDFFLDRHIFDERPLEKEALDWFTASAFDVCLKIADESPESVYKISELLGAIIKRNGSEYVNQVLDVLKEELISSLNSLISIAVHENPTVATAAIRSSPTAVKVGTRAHLFMLLMEELRTQCSAVAQKTELLTRLVHFLVVCHKYVGSSPPRWLSAVLVLIDILLRISVYSVRKSKMLKLTVRTWKWYDLGSGRWARYAPSIDKILNDAYFSGESSVRIVVNRRKYTVQFGSMLQVNDDTGNRRPVMMSLKQDRTLFTKYERLLNDGAKQEEETEKEDDSAYDVEESKKNIVLTSLNQSECELLTRVSVELLKLVSDAESVSAVLRICLRLTRDYKLASLFAELGGIKILLNLTMESSFTGALNVITLLIRHVIEEPRLLVIAIEKVLRSKTLACIPPCYKELLYLMRMCSSAVCRDPDTFIEVAKSVLRVDTSILSRKNFGHYDERLLVKSLPAKTYQPVAYMEEVSKKVIADLLDALVVRDEEPMVVDSTPQQPANASFVPTESCGAFGRNSAAPAATTTPVESNPEVSPAKYAVKRKIPDDPNDMTEEEKKKALLPKSAILKIISDIVRSYPPCAKQVTRHRYHEGQTDLVPEPYTALGFIIDKLLPVDSDAEDKECSAMARMLLSSIASCNQCIEGQITIVQEVRCALQRALSLPESPVKHAHIQLLCGVMSTLIENCPSAPANTPLSFKYCPYSNVSHMVRIMQRRGLVTDLARIPSHLDLSSPSMAPTMNAVLKPLETLTRLLSQPPANSNAKPKAKPAESMAEDTVGPHSGTTTSENTRAHGEETMEDAENTENDISAAGESLEPHSDFQTTSQAMEEGDETGLEDIMEHILDRDAGEEQVIAEHLVVEGRTPVARVDASTPASEPPSRNRNALEFMGDDTQDDDPDSSDTDSDHSREEVEDDDDEDEEEEEEEEVEEEDDDDDDDEVEEDNNEDDDDGYRADVMDDLERDGFFRMPGLEREREDIFMIRYSDPDDIVTQTSTPVHSFNRRNLNDNTVNTRDQQRGNRARRYQYLRMGTRNSNPPAPVILQRLLGPTAHDLPMSSGQALLPGLRDTRVVVMDNGLGIFTNPEEEQIDFVDESGYLYGPSLAATLGNVPTSLHWWNEESKMLDGESAADCVTIVYCALEGFMDQERNIELMERKKVAEKKDKREAASSDSTAQKTDAPKAETVAENPQTVTPAETLEPASTDRSESDSDLIIETVVERGEETRTEGEGPQALPRPRPGTRVGRSASEVEGEGGAGEERRTTGGPSSRVRSSRRLSRSGSDASRRTRATAGPMSRRLRSRDIPTAHSDAQDQARPNELESEDSDVVYLGTFRDTSSASGTPSTSQSGVTMTMYFPSIQGANDGAAGSQGAVDFGGAGDATTAAMDSLYFPQNVESNEVNQGGRDLGAGDGPAPPASVSAAPCPSYFPPVQDNDIQIIGIIAPNGVRSSVPVNNSHVSSQGAQDQSISLDSDGVEMIDTSLNSSASSSGLSSQPPVQLPEDCSPVIVNVVSVTEDCDLGVKNLARDWAQYQFSSEDNDDEDEDDDDDDDDIMILSDNGHSVSGAGRTNRVSAEAHRALTRYVTVEHDYGVDVDSVPVESVLDSGAAQGADEGSGRPGLIRVNLGNVILPEGVDPSFLAALPEEMREEVVAEQVRLQQMRQRAQTQSAADESVAEVPVAEVNPDFLAALPPNIQEEVLAQQRAEQQRQAAAAANPDDPVDAVAFFQNLPPTLRTQILSDMEESQISALSPELAAEAANLRREWETRNRQMMQERFFSHVNPNNSALTSILRNTGRVGARYAIHTVPQQHWRSWASRAENSNPPAPLASAAGGAMVGPCHHSNTRFLLDQETMTCLLVLLFVDEPRLNAGRLHRVVRNLCFNPTTREWLLKTLLSVFDRCATGKPSQLEATTSEYSSKNKRQSSRLLQQAQNMESSGCSTPRSADVRTMVPTWLNIGVDAALGCRANIFSVQRPTGKRGIEKLGAASAAAATLTIHPLAAPTVCKHTLELLIALAKVFPSYYLPMKTPEIESMPKDLTSKDNERFKQKLQAVYAGVGGGLKTKVGPTNFWELLVKLDMMSASKKGKNNCRSYYTLTPPMEFDFFNLCFETSAFGHLVAMLSYPVIRSSTLLTDKLLRLLSLISLGLPDSSPQARKRDRDAVEVADDSEEKKEYNLRMRVPEEYIKLAIEVLTSKSCSEEGLEDATSLLLNWSYGPAPTRDMILRLLLNGAQELGNVLCKQIQTLLKELRILKRKSRREKNRMVNNDESCHERQPAKGVLHDRFTKSTVVVTASTKVKHGSDLQIPAMIPLTSKTSSQVFFLRTLKVIIQLREAIQLSIKKNKRKGNSGNSGTSSSTETAASTEQPRPVTIDLEESRPPPAVLPRGARQRETVAARLMNASSENIEGRTQPRSEENAVGNGGDSGGSMQTSTQESPQPTRTGADESDPVLPILSEQLGLDELWKVLSDCLLELQDTPDHHAVLVLQPAVEAFFLIHASSSDKEEKEKKPGERQAPAETRETPAVQHELAPVSPLPAEGEASPVLNFQWDSPSSSISNDTVKFLKFAETHRTVLNQILRQSTSPLSEGPFAVLVDHTRILDFDVKRRYFRAELERLDDGLRREELAVHVRRSNVFEDSFRELHRRFADEWKNRFYIVFEGEEGQDAGGLLREWYVIISRDIFNPNYALFTTSPGDRVTYTINPASHYNHYHLCYFKFVGRVIAKAIYDNKLLECYFTRSFYKHILGIPVKYTDMESEDYSFYKGLVYLMENRVSDLGDLTFSTEVQEFGVTEVRDLIPNGRNILVSEENKMDYVQLVCQMKMTGAIMKQLNAFLEGFYDIIPKKLISIFNEQELELLISGLPNIDIDELRANTEYHKYQASSLQIKWFWRALRSFEQADRAKFLQFVTGTSKVPLQGFAALEGMNGMQKFQIHRDERSTDRLPSAHTCFNQLDLPVYETYDKLRKYLLKAIQECSEGFGFA